MSNKVKISLWLIFLSGFLLRTLFTLFFASDFFNRSDIFTDGDTLSWLNSFINLWENDSFSANLEHEYGYFFRTPGYSFFMGIFYLLIGNNPDILFPAIGWTQIIIDTFSILLVYKITIRLFGIERTALIASALYSSYPFIIVWTPVCYSETLSIFFLLLSLKYLFDRYSWYSLFVSGIFLGLGILTRPQLLIFTPFFFLMLFIFKRESKYIILFLIFALGIAVSYGVWPARNLINHNKLILTQDLRSAKNWNKDVISFMQYTYSVKPEWEPQFSSIIKNTKTEWPELSYRTKSDSMLLITAVGLSKHYGSGFSFWNGYWKNPFPDNKTMTTAISTIFNYLRNNQIRNNPYNFWVKVPFQNLSKALFKSSLYNTDTTSRKYGSLLFYYRTFLISIGLIGCFLLLRNSNKVGWLFILCFVVLYVTLCFGTAPQMRNIEIRYFLPADILLLFPASYIISYFYSFKKK